MKLVKTRVEIEGTVHEELSLADEEPKPWGADADLRVVGVATAKIDGAERVTGRARYTSDVTLPGMLHAKAVRSPYAHARVKRLDASKALALPGVRAVISGENVPRVGWFNGTRLFDGVARFAGDEVAAVAADDEETAEEAVKLIEVEYEQLPFHLDAEEAAKAPPLHGSSNLIGGSPKTYRRGDVEKALREAEVVVEADYATQTEVHHCMETHGAVASWEGGRLTVWESTQSIQNVREELSEALGVPLGEVRVICHYVGGGFGSKQVAYKYTLIASLLSKMTGRPVRMLLSRREESLGTGNRQATTQHIRIAARSDGTLTAIDLAAMGEVGAYGEFGWMTEGPAQRLYACSNVRTVNGTYFTNLGPAKAFRGPGYAEGSFALESAIDELADRLGIDPLELRLRNYSEADPQTGRAYSQKRLRECYRRGAELIGWDGNWGRCVTGSRCRALGVATQIWGGGGGPPAYAWVKMSPDASFEVIVGGQDIGSGTKTCMAQIAAEELGVGIGRVRVRMGDTEAAPYAPVSSGSRTMPSVGPAVRQAAADARRQLIELAADYMDVPTDRIAFDGGSFTARPERSPYIGLEDLAAKVDELTILGRGVRGPNPRDVDLMTWGAQFADVEVDTLTGDVEVKRIVTVHDIGRVLNPLCAGGQLEGGVVQGIGYAFTEGRVVDRRDGVVLNPGLEDYLIPTAMDTPMIQTAFIDEADEAANSIGAKGLGEPPMIPTAPAVANAISRAIGVRIRSLPITREKILAALDEAKEGEGSR